MDKRLQIEIDEEVQHKNFESLAYTNHEFNDLPPCFSCPTTDCEAVNCIKLELWFNKMRQIH